MANLVAADLVTVHPLDAPTGVIFYFDKAGARAAA